MSASAKVDPSLANITRLAVYFELGRDTIRKRLEAAGVSPAQEIGQTRYFKISEAAQACFGEVGRFNPGADAENLTPSEEKDYWMARLKEVEFKRTISEYVEATEVRKEFKALYETIDQVIQSYPDILERDEGLPPKEVDSMVRLCDQLSKTIYDACSE